MILQWLKQSAEEKKQTPIISNTGFIGSVLIDTLSYKRNPIISLVKTSNCASRTRWSL